MKSWKIAEFSGIGVYVHWSFLILLLWVGSSALSSGASAAMALQSVAFVLAIFGCVVLHEFGHALMARQFGIGTRSITLLPIGGVAALDRMPRRPLHEFAVAVAGPAVNVAIAAILFAILLMTGTVSNMLNVSLFATSFLTQLLVANVVLVLFNMLPAFPMDGGRVLRSVLASFLPHAKATQYAAVVGQVMAVLFGLVGLYSGQWMLLFVAMFVYFAGRSEAAMAQAQGAIEGRRVADAMWREFHIVPAHVSLSEAAPHLLYHPQDDFPVIDGNRLVGMLAKQQVLALLQQGRGYLRVDQAMRADVPTLDQQQSLAESIDQMRSGHYSSMPVASEGRLVGVLSVRSMQEAAMGVAP